MIRGVRSVVSAVVAVQIAALPLLARAADPQCFAASTDGQQLALQGKLTAARERFAVCAASSCPKEVADDCRERLSKVEADLPSIVISVKNANVMRLTIDGADVALATDGNPILLDPGGHDVHAELVGAQPVDKHVELVRGQKGVVVEIAAPAAAPPADVAPPPNEPTAPSTRKPIPTATWILGGVGAVGLVCFAGFGIAALKQSSDLHGSAPGTYTTDDVDALKRKRLLADVSLGVGVVAIAAAAVIWFAQPTPETKDAAAFDVRVVSGGAVATFGGAF